MNLNERMIRKWMNDINLNRGIITKLMNDMKLMDESSVNG